MLQIHVNSAADGYMICLVAVKLDEDWPIQVVFIAVGGSTNIDIDLDYRTKGLEQAVDLRNVVARIHDCVGV